MQSLDRPPAIIIEAVWCSYDQSSSGRARTLSLFPAQYQRPTDRWRSASTPGFRARPDALRNICLQQPQQGVLRTTNPQSEGNNMVKPFGDPDHKRPRSQKRLDEEKPPTNIPKPYELMQPPPVRGWWDLLPWPSLDSPYAPVPSVPPIPLPPREVDPPSRPPEWLFGPPRITGVSGQLSSPGRAPRGLPALLAEAGVFDPSYPEAAPAGGLPGLIQKYLRNGRHRGY